MEAIGCERKSFRSSKAAQFLHMSVRPCRQKQGDAIALFVGCVDCKLAATEALGQTVICPLGHYCEIKDKFAAPPEIPRGCDAREPHIRLCKIFWAAISKSAARWMCRAPRALSRNS